MTLILVEAWRDGMGNIYAQPVRADRRRKLAKHIRRFTGWYEQSAFFQEGGPAEEFMTNLPARHRRDLENGLAIRFKIDPWIVGHWYGYDAHDIIG